MNEANENKDSREAQALVVRGTTPPAPRRGGLALLLALLALLLAAWSAWRVHVAEQDDRRSTALSQLSARLDGVENQIGQRQRDLEGLRARLGDADTVNKSLREEVLALAERVRHVEDAIAHLAELRLSGRDALALNETEFLLVQAQERLALFHDADAALAAYRLADAALASAEDPAFASVRRTISAERDALAAAKPVDLRANLDAIERLRAALPRMVAAPVPTPAAQTSRWREILDSFVRVGHVDGAGNTAHEPAFSRAVIALDLRDAQAALLGGDPKRYEAALRRARDGIATLVDGQSAAVQSALAEIDRLLATPLAPALPELGSALRELRALRATRALAEPKPIAPAPTTTPSEKSASGDAT